MNNIYLNTSNNKTLNFDTFEEKMIEICKEQRLNGKALAFAFILYDLTRPEIKKLLDDSDYWNSLNEISGDRICVFSIHSENKNIQNNNIITSYHQKRSYRTRYNDKFDRKGIGTSKMVVRHAMQKVISNRNVTQSEQSIIKKYFDIEPPRPSILFYQVNNERVISAFYVKLKERRVEDAYLEIERNIRMAARSISQVKIENKQNFEEIYRLMCSNVEAYNNRLEIYTIAKAVWLLSKNFIDYSI